MVLDLGLDTRDVARAAAARASTVAEPVTKPWGQLVAYVRDLDGLLVELSTPKTDQAQRPALAPFVRPQVTDE